MQYIKNPPTIPSRIIVLPLVSSLIIPLIIFDIWVEIYHRICFSIYGVPWVKRSNFIKIDRHKLKYLTFIQKIYCVYCGYGNGVIQYWAKIAGETERFWCGIQHEKTKGFHQQEHQKNFAKYEDEADCKMKYQ